MCEAETSTAKQPLQASRLWLGKRSPKYISVRNNLTKITDALRHIPETKKILSEKFKELGWLGLTPNPDEGELVAIILKRIEEDDKYFEQFIAILKNIDGMDQVVNALTKSAAYQNEVSKESREEYSETQRSEKEAKCSSAQTKIEDDSGLADVNLGTKQPSIPQPKSSKPPPKALLSRGASTDSQLGSSGMHPADSEGLDVSTSGSNEMATEAIDGSAGMLTVHGQFSSVMKETSLVPDVGGRTTTTAQQQGIHAMQGEEAKQQVMSGMEDLIRLAVKEEVKEHMKQELKELKEHINKELGDANKALKQEISDESAARNKELNLQLKRENEELRQEIAQLRDEFDRYQRSTDTEKKKHSENFERKLCDLEQRNDQLQKAFEDLQMRLSKSEQVREKLMEEKEQMRQENMQLRQEISRLRHCYLQDNKENVSQLKRIKENFCKK